MNDQAESSRPASDRGAEPVHTAPYLDLETSWFGPRWGGLADWGFIALAAALLLTMRLGMWVIGWLMETSSVLDFSLAVNCLVFWAIVGFAMKRQNKHLMVRAAPRDQPNVRRSDPRYRLRIVGDAMRAYSWVRRTEQDVGFEPMVWPASRGVLWERPVISRVDGSVERTTVSSLAPTNDRWRKVFRVVVFVAVFRTLGVILAEYLPGGHLAAAAAGAALIGAIAASWTYPIYVRIAPGRMDVFRYGPLGLGKPAVDRYDLRQARVLLSTGGSVRIEDASRAVGRVVYIHVDWVFLGWKGHQAKAEEFGRAVLAASRTRTESPSLPMDEFVG